MERIERKTRDKLIAATQRLMRAKSIGDKAEIRRAYGPYYRYRAILKKIQTGEYPMIKKAEQQRLENIKLLFNASPDTRIEMDNGKILHGWGLMAEEGGMAESLDGLSDADILLAYDEFIECGRREDEYAE